MLCNLTIQKLEAQGVNVLGNCPVSGCGLPVAFHRDETVVPPQGIVRFPPFYCIVSIVLFHSAHPPSSSCGIIF
jgi:hypothetical protein